MTAKPGGRQILEHAMLVIQREDYFAPNVHHEGDILLALFVSAEELLGPYVAGDVVRITRRLSELLGRNAFDYFDDPFRTRDDVMATLAECSLEFDLPPLVLAARRYAKAAHDSIGQRRKYRDEPYWKHPERVASLVRRAGLSDEAVAAAFLHDTIEDVPSVTPTKLHALFSPRVAELVQMVTKPDCGLATRALRKEKAREHYARGDAEAQTIKLADVIDNVDTIAEDDPAFARIYLFEQRALVDVLTKGNETLLHTARVAVVRGIERLGMTP